MRNFNEIGLPAPNQYDDWRSWASALMVALDGMSGEETVNFPLYVRDSSKVREGLPAGADGDTIRVRDEDGKNRLYVYEGTEGWKSTQETSADSDLENILENIDYVVESKTATDDDPTWYRVYKSGWIEQGGRIKAPVTVPITINLLKPFANTNYTFLVMGMGYTATSHYAIGETRGTSRTKTSIQITSQYDDSNFNSIDWVAYGQGA